MTVSETSQIVIPNRVWRDEVEKLSRQNISACYQCEKCTNGCPVAFAMDLAPHRLMHSIHLGLKNAVLKKNTFWVCASCETCTTRCPNGIDIAHVMDTLKHMSLREGNKPERKDIPIFHNSFLNSIKKHGRLSEFEMITDYTLKSEGLAGLLKQAGMGLKMFVRGKISLLPRSSNAKEVKNIFKKIEEQQ